MLNRANARNPLSRFVEREVTRLVPASVRALESSAANFPGSAPSPLASDSTFAGPDGETNRILYWDLDEWDSSNATW